MYSLFMSSIAARLRGVRSALSPAEARVADLVAGSLDSVAHMTVTDLAAASGASTATVVRTVRRLGFGGYPDFRFAAAEEAGRAEASRSQQDHGLRDLVEDVADDEPPAGILAKLAAFEADQLAATATLVDPEQLGAAIAAVSAARRVVVLGIGASGLVAQDLAQKLGRIGMVCAAVTERDAALVHASLLGPSDVVIAVSHSGENRGVAEPFAVAARTGATTVAITGAPRSTVGRTAAHVLFTAGREFGLRSAAMASRSSQLLAVDALYIGVAQRSPGARAALERTYAAVRTTRTDGDTA